MPTVRLIFGRRAKLGSLLVRYTGATGRARWSHVGVLIDGQVWEARVGHTLGPTPLESFLERHSTTQIVRYRVPNPLAGEAWLEERAGAPYAYWSALTLWFKNFGLSESQNDADHCSEVAENYLQACGLRRWRDGLHRIHPNDTFNNLRGVVA